MSAEPTRADFCAGCAIKCLCDVSEYEDRSMSDSQLDAIAALDVDFADDASIIRGGLR
jgi:hypothetical protein